MGKSDPACRNASNPYHECVEFCLEWIAGEKERYQREFEKSKNEGKAPEDRTVHPDCVNAANPYHECGEFCFRRIAEAKERAERAGEELQHGDQTPSSLNASNLIDVPSKQAGSQPEETAGSISDSKVVDKEADDGYPQLTGRQKKVFELQLKMNEARKANQVAMVAEKNKQEAPSESRGVSKSKWMEERTKRIGKLLDSNGLDMSKAYMLDTQEMAEAKYKKWEKEPAPYGWDVFNQKTLYNAHKKRTKNIKCDMDAYNKAKEEDPEFYRKSSSLQYGKAQKVSEENVDRMVTELLDRDAKRKAFSRRRKFHDEKDIDSINDRNEHFNKKIERAFGKYTLEIKNNLERGTALPD